MNEEKDRWNDSGLNDSLFRKKVNLKFESVLTSGIVFTFYLLELEGCFCGPRSYLAEFGFGCFVVFGLRWERFRVDFSRVDIIFQWLAFNFFLF